MVTPESGRSSSSYVVGELYEDVSLHTRIHVDDDDTGYIALLARSRGDATLFARRDEVEEAWRYVTPILEAWDADRRTPLASYPVGGAGPLEAEQLLARNDHAWRPLR